MSTYLEVKVCGIRGNALREIVRARVHKSGHRGPATCMSRYEQTCRFLTGTRPRPVAVSPSKPGADRSKWPASAGTFDSELPGHRRAAGSSQQPTLQGARSSRSEAPTRCRRYVCDDNCQARPCSACTRSSVTTILTDGDHCAGSQTLSSRWSSMNSR